MEVILKKEQKLDIDEMAEFLNSLNQEEKNVFKGIIDGFKLARTLEKGKGVN